MDVIIWILLILLFSIASAVAAAYFAHRAGRAAGLQAEQERQRQLFMSAEDQAERILAEAETKIETKASWRSGRQVRCATTWRPNWPGVVRNERIEERLQNRLDGAERRSEARENRSASSTNEVSLDQRKRNSPRWNRNGLPVAAWRR